MYHKNNFRIDGHDQSSMNYTQLTNYKISRQIEEHLPIYVSKQEAKTLFVKIDFKMLNHLSIYGLHPRNSTPN